MFCSTELSNSLSDQSSHEAQPYSSQEEARTQLPAVGTEEQMVDQEAAGGSSQGLWPC